MTAQPRCVALVGPFQSGKTALFEAILRRTGAAAKTGRGDNRVGDPSPEARAHKLSVEATVATCEFMGDRYAFVDCPGSVEFAFSASAALPACDVAVVVCEADERKIPQLELVLRELEELKLPHLLFLNKIDATPGDVHQALAALQKASRAPLLLRQIPILENGQATGFIDLALERAFVYREGGASETIELPKDEVEHEKQERFHMLETLADHDDKLMEDLIMEVEPERARIFADLASELRENHAVSVLLGSALKENGVTRLLKALRHEAPGLAETRARLGVSEDGPPLAYAMKTAHPGFGGKITTARVLRGSFREGDGVKGSSGGEDRVASLVSLVGEQTTRVAEAGVGEVAGFLKLDSIGTGEAFSAGARPRPVAAPQAPSPVHSVALHVRDRKDDVRLSAALAKLVEEDPSLSLESRADLGELRLHGLGRDASARRPGTARLALSGRGRRDAAECRLQRDAETAGRGAWPAQEAERRPRPVRRREDRGAAARARRGLRVRGQGRRRLGAAPVHPLGRDRLPRLGRARAARPSGRGLRRDAGRRLVPHGGFVRRGLPGGRPYRHDGSFGGGRIGAAGADPRGDGHGPGLGDRRA